MFVSNHFIFLNLEYPKEAEQVLTLYLFYIRVKFGMTYSVNFEFRTMFYKSKEPKKKKTFDKFDFKHQYH